MSKLTEYLKLIPRALTNPEALVEGWMNELNLTNLTQDEKDEIIRRRAICLSCPLLSTNVKKDNTEYLKLMKEEFVTDRTEEFCTMCGCPLGSKTASLSSNCGVEWYNKNHPENKQELKWITYNKPK